MTEKLVRDITISPGSSSYEYTVLHVIGKSMVGHVKTFHKRRSPVRQLTRLQLPAVRFYDILTTQRP
jgi:hypothetical protein